jgi:sugar O-acyltransferase (sialic acid O-acetyltransferase NeuD family)
MKKLIIAGCGGFAKEVYWLAQCLGLEVEAFIDLEEREDFCGKPVKTLDFFNKDQHRVVLAVGSPVLRKEIKETFPPDTEFPTLIHPSAQIGFDVTIGKGSVICSNVVITANVNLGEFAQLNLLSTVGHDVITGNYFTTAPLTAISGRCNFGDLCYFGTHSSSIEGICVTDNCIIGANACVVKDILEPGTYIGTPAKKLK